MKIRIMNLFVDDQDKALQFYTGKLGFQTKSDFSNGGYRWLTVVSADDPEGVELVLGPAEFDAAAQAYQKALHDEGRPFAMFFVDDINAEYERLKAAGVTFTQEPTRTTGSTIAMLDDTVGNIIQISQIDAWS